VVFGIATTSGKDFPMLTFAQRNIGINVTFRDRSRLVAVLAQILQLNSPKSRFRQALLRSFFDVLLPSFLALH